MPLGRHGARLLLKSIFSVCGQADVDCFRRNLSLLPILFLLGAHLEDVKGVGGCVGDERSEGRQVAVTTRCGNCPVSFPKAIEEARHRSELSLLHGTPVATGSSPPQRGPEASRGQSSDPFIAVRFDIFDSHFQGGNLNNHRVVDRGVAAALLARKERAHRCADAGERANNVCVSELSQDGDHRQEGHGITHKKKHKHIFWHGPSVSAGGLDAHHQYVRSACGVFRRWLPHAAGLGAPIHLFDANVRKPRSAKLATISIETFFLQTCDCSNACFQPRPPPLAQNHAHMHMQILHVGRHVNS